MLPGGLLLGVLGRPVGTLFDRVGARPLVIPGAVLVAGSMWLFATLGAGSSVPAVVGIHMLLMGGLALMMTPLMTEALQVAGAFGTAVFVTVAALASASGTPDAAGLHAAFVVAGCVGIVAAGGG